MGYKHDMSSEQGKKQLLPEGQREFRIKACREEMSKAGNEMFVFTFQDILTGYSEEVYAIAEKGKRWFLKSILDACEIEAAKDGVYEWDIKDVINQTVLGIVIQFDDEWINRTGQTVKTKKHKIQDITSAKQANPFNE